MANPIDTLILLDPFEERFDFPSRFIQVSNGPSGKDEVVGHRY